MGTPLFTLTGVIISFFLAFLDLGLANPPKTNSTPRGKFAEVHQLFKAGKYNQVIERLSKKLEQLGTEDLLILGRSYSKVGSSSNAQRTFSSILAKDPRHQAAKTELGAELLTSGKDKEALQLLREAVELNPKEEAPYLILIQLYEKKKNRYELRLLYQDMVQALGERPLYISKLCQLSTAEGLHDLALQYCRRAIFLSPNDPMNSIYLGQVFNDTGNPEKALKTFSETTKKFPKSDLANFTFGLFLKDRKNFIDSYVYFKRAVNANPKEAKYWVEFARSALELQKYQEALNGFRRACSLDKLQISAVRQAANVIRLTNQDNWLSKFEALTEQCQ